MEDLRQCIKCNSIKPTEHFYRYKLCKSCHNNISVYNYMMNAEVANKLNISIEELNKIMTIH